MTNRTSTMTSALPLARRELAVLVGISLATVLFLAVVAEAGTRWWWPERERNDCYRRVPGGAFRPTPHCSASVKNAEGPWVTMRYNGCGYRSARPCGPTPSGTRRLVVMGSSIADGFYIPYEKTFLAILENSLTRMCGGPVEIQNVASLQRTPDLQWTLLKEVVGLTPDAVLLVWAPYDLLSFTPTAPGVALERRGRTAAVAEPSVTAISRLRVLARESRVLSIAQHFMLEHDGYLFRVYQLGREDDVLRVPMSNAYRERFAGLESELKMMRTRLASESIPLFVVPVPSRIEAALMSDRVELPNVDPWLYLHEMEAIAGRDSVGLIDVFPAFAGTPHAERLFYAVDGHPTSDAQNLIANAIERALLDGSVPAFANCRNTQ